MSLPTNELVANSANVTDNNVIPSVEDKQYLINEDKYRLLREYQQQIYQLTDVSPSLRKLINDLITSENLEKIKTILIKSLKS